MASTATGTIKRLTDKGFGFIAAPDGVEYFFHRSGVDRDLNFDSLQGGERVVSSANFLIDAESKVQGALKDFEQEKPKEAAGSSVKP